FLNASSGTLIQANQMELNTAAGIVLAGGANGGIAAPTLTTPVGGGPGHSLSVTLTTAGTIDVYKVDSAVSGQGKTYLMSHGPDPAGLVSFNLNALVASGDDVVATVTDNTNSTSAF